MSNNQISFLEDPKYIRYHIGTPLLPKIWAKYEEARMTRWTEQEIFNELKVDYSNISKMPDDVREVLLYILGFFAGGDKFVVEVAQDSIIDRITHIEVQMLLRQFTVQEDIHNIVYSRLCETYAINNEELNNMFSAIESWPSVKAKIDWSKTWLNEASLAQALLCNVVFEGLFFSSSFCYIFWLDEYYPKLFPGIKLANMWISNDEFNHQSTGISLYKSTNGIDDSLIYQMFSDAVNVESQFVLDAFSSIKLPGMNADLMIQYVKYVADEILNSLELDSMFNIENPFSWMVKLRINARSPDFFIWDSIEYNKPDKNPEVDVCEFDEDF